MEQGLEKANREYTRSSRTSNSQALTTYIPIVDLLSLYFDIDEIHSTGESQREQKALNRYTKVINPIVDMAGMVFGIQDLKSITSAAFGDLRTSTAQNVVEGALISIENETGYITAIIGGSKYDESNQLIRATQGNIQPGSSFKPLYYSAAIDSRKFNPASLIHDVPIVFHNEDGTPYIPLNFRGEWKGSVLLYEALAQSMNVPSLRVLDSIGFDSAINRAAALLDITDPDQIRQTFPRVYPLGLGVISASPLRMARAFAVFASQGRSVTPIAIRSVEDRNGRIVLDPERELRQRQRQLGEEIQVISPQNAYIMTSMLKKTVELGTLYNPSGWGSKFTFKDAEGKNFRMPMAGKTGTPQNWSDAWTVGFSPYYTTAIWFGFDKPGNSLGVNLTGSTLAGPVWADYMREIHQGLEYREFARPATGVIDVTVCAKSGLLKTAACNQGEMTLPFLEGTQPSEYCNVHTGAAYAATTYLDYMRSTTLGLNNEALLDSLTMPALPPDLPLERPRAAASRTPASRAGIGLPRPRTAPRPAPSRNSPARVPNTSILGTRGNRLLDGDDPAPSPYSREGDVRESPDSFPGEDRDSLPAVYGRPEGGGYIGGGPVNGPGEVPPDRGAGDEPGAEEQSLSGFQENTLPEGENTLPSYNPLFE
jgi:penicillin-binding protein 1A